MLKVHSEPPKPSLEPSGSVLFALGFRPFFAAAAISAVVLILSWLAIWSAGIWASSYYGVIGWHSHEMLFGYASAIIAGFLLTAVRNWTGVNTPSGAKLAMLAALWLAGRLLPLLDGWVPGLLIALTDLAFLPAVALAIRPALWQGEQKVNRIFVPLLLLMGVANLLVHLQSLGVSQTAVQGIDMMLYLVLFLVALIGGRVMPFFTQAVIPQYTAVRRRWAEIGTVVGFGLLVILQLTPLPATATGLVATILALVQIVRVSGWYHPQVWRIPILWVLYTGMFWLITGLLLTGLASLGLLAPTLATHALTIGGIGVLTLGMMARVSLGHTGRPLQPVRSVELAFVALNLGVAVRVFGPMLNDSIYTFWVHLSGGLWIISFTIFAIVYLPILSKPRADGKPG